MASLNVWGLRWPLSRDREPRMAAIADALPALNADAIAFQEVWTADFARALIDAGGAAGLHHSFDAQAETGGSGLLVLTKRPIEAVRFEPYATAGLPQRIWHGDYWGRKGYVELQLSTPAGPLSLIDTHLHAQYRADAYPEYRCHRMGQIVQLAARLAAIGTPLIAAGDFNMMESEEAYHSLVGLSGLRDCAAERESRQPTSLRSNPYQGDRGDPDSRIDYVFVRDGINAGIEVRRVERAFDTDLAFDGRRGAYSDHAGVVADLALTPGRGAFHEASPRALRTARDALEAGRTLAERRRGTQRALALGGVSLGGMALAGRRSAALDRRRFLRGLTAGIAGIAGSAALGIGALSEFAVDREIREYERVERLLSAMPRRTPVPPV